MPHATCHTSHAAGTRLVLGNPYRVLPNETLSSIAFKFGTTPDVLFAINQPLFLDQQRVYPGAAA
jgi:hypothetical protein